VPDDEGLRWNRARPWRAAIRSKRAVSPASIARSSGVRGVPDGGKTRGLSTASRGRRRLPGDTLIEFELGLGLNDTVPVRRRLWGSSQAGGPRAWWLTARQEDLLDGRGLGDEGDDAHLPAGRQVLAPQLGQTSGSDSNSRASRIAHR